MKPSQIARGAAWVSCVLVGLGAEARADEAPPGAEPTSRSAATDEVPSVPEGQPADVSGDGDARAQIVPPAEPFVFSKENEAQPGLWGRPVRRGGFHLQVGFGVGGGPDTSGLFHTMELGWSFGDHTIALLHTFIQNKGILGTNPAEPDLIGGWMVEYKTPLFYRDLEIKVALGLGGTHEQRDDGLIAHPGFGASYGFDLHFPVWERFGPTLTVATIHATAQGQHHFGVGTAFGVTLF